MLTLRSCGLLWWLLRDENPWKPPWKPLKTLPLRDPLRGRFPSQRLSVLLPLIVLPLKLSPKVHKNQGLFCATNRALWGHPCRPWCPALARIVETDGGSSSRKKKSLIWLRPPPKENLLGNFSGLKKKLSRSVVDTKTLEKPGKPHLPPKSFLCGPLLFPEQKKMVRIWFGLPNPRFP